MATLEEIYAKIVSDDTEKKALAEAFATEEGAAAFLEQRGCEASPVELVALMREKAGAAGELADEDLEGAVGAAWGDWVVSFVGLAVTCGLHAIISVVANSDVTKEWDNPHATKITDGPFDICHE